MPAYVYPCPHSSRPLAGYLGSEVFGLSHIERARARVPGGDLTYATGVIVSLFRYFILILIF